MRLGILQGMHKGENGSRMLFMCIDTYTSKATVVLDLLVYERQKLISVGMDTYLVK